MPRRGSISKRDVLPDPIYGSKLVTRLVNSIMYDGKKGVAQKIVYDAFDIVKEKTGKDALEAYQAAMDNIMPLPTTRSPSRSVPKDASPSVCVGSPHMPVPAARKP